MGCSVPSGDPDGTSFAEVFQAHTDRLREQSRKLVRPEWGSVHSVSDLLHEVYVRAQARWEKFERAGNCSAEVWLIGQLIDTVRDLNRRYLAAKRRAEAELFISRLASLLAGTETTRWTAPRAKSWPSGSRLRWRSSSQPSANS